jgi:hypothetical protein
MPMTLLMIALLLGFFGLFWAMVRFSEQVIALQ